MTVDHYFQDDFYLKARYVGENLGEDNIMEVWFEDIKEDVLVEIYIFIRNHVVESSKIKGHLNDWEINVIKVNTRSIWRLYRVKGIDRGYRLWMYRRSSKQDLEAKSNIPRDQKANISINECNKVKKDWEKFRNKIPNNFREAFLLDNL